MPLEARSSKDLVRLPEVFLYRTCRTERHFQFQFRSSYFLGYFIRSDVKWNAKFPIKLLQQLKGTSSKGIHQFPKNFQLDRAVKCRKFWLNGMRPESKCAVRTKESKGPWQHFRWQKQQTNHTADRKRTDKRKVGEPQKWDLHGTKDLRFLVSFTRYFNVKSEERYKASVTFFLANKGHTTKSWNSAKRLFLKLVDVLQPWHSVIMVCPNLQAHERNDYSGAVISCHSLPTWPSPVFVPTDRVKL